MDDCNCEIETELEWRSRISLGDAQHLLARWFRGQTGVYTEEYRLRRYARYIRRMGCRIEFERYDFDTIGDFLCLCGLAWDDSPPRTATVTCFSNVKTTNCNHLIFYPFRTRNYEVANSPDVSLQSSKADDLVLENMWPPVFLLKRSLEMNESFLDVSSLSAVDTVEMDRSDNNLGGAVVRKTCRNLILRDNHREYLCRLALYSILDEYQQVRFELALECELGRPERIVCRSPIRNYFEHMQAPICTRSREVHRFSDSNIYNHMDAIYSLVRTVTQSLDFTERTMIQLNIDWIPNDLGTPIVSSATTTAAGENEHEEEDEENNVSADRNSKKDSPFSQASLLSYNTRLLSYVLPPEHVGSVENFVHFVRQKIGSKLRMGDVTVRPKINGIRLYASFDGRDKLYCDNGEVVKLSSVNPRKSFTTDMIYQLERIVDKSHKIRYVLTEVIVVRNSFSCQLNALSQSFSPSSLPYSYGEEQQWPYGLDGTGLSAHETLAILQFWTLSACSTTSSSNLVKRFVDTLRKKDVIEKGDTGATTKTIANEDEENDDIIELHPDPNELDFESDADESADESHSDVSQNAGVPACSVCLPCRKLQHEGLRNSNQSFTQIKGKNWDNQNFITVPMNDSFTLINRIHATLEATGENGLIVNRAIYDEHELVRRAENFYRHYILRLCDILFLADRHEMCFSMLNKHFPRDEVQQYVKMYRETKQSIADTYAEEPAIDGFLLYIPSLETEHVPHRVPACSSPEVCRPRARNTCTIDLARRRGQRNGGISAFKLKPYQSIELLLEVSTVGAQLQLDFCVRDSIVEQQQTLRARTFLRCSNVNRCPDTGRTQLNNAKWVKSDSQECDVHMDPRVSLMDRTVYEFVCYNERAFFLTIQRPDKLLPDSEDKINSIVYSRKKLTSVL